MFTLFRSVNKLNFLIALPVYLILTSCGAPSATEVVTPNYKHIGDSIISATFDTLRSALTNAMQSKGAAGAVSFCNEKAYPITATYTSSHISLKRVAEKYRNPNNAPDSLDALQWAVFVSEKESGKPLEPILIEDNKITHYYKPIVLQPTCIACHGNKGKDILPQVLTTIDSLYPQDLATGFAAGDLRGMWKVSFGDN